MSPVSSRIRLHDYSAQSVASRQDGAAWPRSRRKRPRLTGHQRPAPTLLAIRRLSKASFILIRSADPLTANQIADLIIDHIAT